jgi:hypothetical protein
MRQHPNKSVKRTPNPLRVFGSLRPLPQALGTTGKVGMRLKNQAIRHTVQVVLGTSAWLARRESMNAVTEWLMNSLAKATIKSKNIREATDLEDLGKQWQRGFPSAKQVPIKSVTENTVFAEIHTPCPLRGTGDVHACYRMMQFDRKVVEQAGGKFVVLSSQATAGNEFCTVAMRKKGVSVADLTPAHAKSEKGS